MPDYESPQEQPEYTFWLLGRHVSSEGSERADAKFCLDVATSAIKGKRDFTYPRRTEFEDQYAVQRLDDFHVFVWVESRGPLAERVDDLLKSLYRLGMIDAPVSWHAVEREVL